MATNFIPAPGISAERLADAAQLASLADETPEGRSVVVLAKQRFNLRGREVAEPQARFVPFSAQTRMSGVDFIDGFEKPQPALADGHGSVAVVAAPVHTVTRSIRKGAAEAMRSYVEQKGGRFPQFVTQQVEAISHSGGTPLVVADSSEVLGVIHLKDVVKGGIKERFAQLRKMGIRTVMITGDNPQTAAAIAAEAGVDDFIAQATPEAKLKRIRTEQADGHLVAMTGDGTNDAPALAQAERRCRNEYGDSGRPRGVQYGRPG
jgi:K+-transporting ATPase ATPase B chain